MASSLLRRVWNTLRSPTRCVGKDLEGNKYYEYPNPNDGFGRTKRVVKYRHGYDMWTYIAGERRLPVQWTAWLTHTRIHAPTIEELQADLIRQERVRLRAAMIQAASNDATPTTPALVNNTQPPNSVDLTSTATTSVPQTATGQPSLGSPHIDHEARSDPVIPSQEVPLRDEPEAWTPRVSQRRSK